jgi:hypothetical protein
MRRKQTYSLEESIKRALRDPYFYSNKEVHEEEGEE